MAAKNNETIGLYRVPSVVVPHWFQSGSSISGQWGSGSRVLITKNWRNLLVKTNSIFF